MSITFYNPNVSVKPTGPEGFVGPNAVVYLPCYGYWSPSGYEYTFTNGEAPQKAAVPLQGLTRPDTFQKNGAGCTGSWGPI